MTVQTTYNNDLDLKFAGRIAFGRTSTSCDIHSKYNEETAGIAFGRVTAKADTNNKKVRLPRSSQGLITFAGTTSAGDTITGNLVLNGTSNAISVPFNTSHPLTMVDLQTAVDALTGTSSVISGSDLILTIPADSEVDLTLNTWAAAGGSAPAITVANSESGTFNGISVYTEKQPAADGNGSGDALYLDNETVNQLRKGYIDVQSEDALDPGDAVYVRFYEEAGASQKAGMLKSSDGLASEITRAALWSAAEVIDGCSAGGFATVAINLP